MTSNGYVEASIHYRSLFPMKQQSEIIQCKTVGKNVAVFRQLYYLIFNEKPIAKRDYANQMPF
jgi:hypothetical protein